MSAAATPAERWHAVLRTALAETYIATTARERNVMAAKYRSVAVDLRSISTRIQGDSYLNTIASDLDDMAALIQPHPAALIAGIGCARHHDRWALRGVETPAVCPRCGHRFTRTELAHLNPARPAGYKPPLADDVE